MAEPFEGDIYLEKHTQRFKIIYFRMGPWDPQAKILMGPRALGMSLIIAPHHQPFVREIHWLQQKVDFPHKGLLMWGFDVFFM